MIAPDLSVIVVTHNGRDQALTTMLSARAGAGMAAIEWFVVDSGSTDGTPDAIEAQFPDVRLFRCDNIGFAAANNVALEHARARNVLLLNPDVELLRGTLADLVRALDERAEVGVASVIQRAPDGTTQASIGRFPTTGRQLGEALLLPRIPGLRHLQEMETRQERYERECSADWLVGAFLAVKADALAAVGGLDERFFMYSEEKDWCYRIRKAGWDVRHLPSLEVVHHGGGYGSPALRAQLTYSKLLFASKHFGLLRRSGIRVALAIRHALRSVALLVRVSHRADERRLHGELRALAITLGRTAIPFAVAASVEAENAAGYTSGARRLRAGDTYNDLPAPAAGDPTGDVPSSPLREPGTNHLTAGAP